MNTPGTDAHLRPLGPEDPREVAGYRLLARIGEGGMGSVYLSRTRGNQPVALKVIRREYAQDEEFRRRFEQEARSARQVQGYHIVPVVDHDTTGPQPWLATTFVPGLPLDEVLSLHGPLPLPTVLQLTGCAAEALHAVHKAGVIHRDMKPSNILLGSEGPWVIDFGIARAADATQLTRSGGLIGTPQFMSPEHANGQALTPATDIFSLGLIAAVAATGRHPYGEAGAITLATQIANTELRPPNLTDYPEALRTVLERCLVAEPAARPSPSVLAELCTELSRRRLRDFGGWLPATVAADIARRERLAQQPPETEPGTAADGAAGGVTMPPGTLPHGAAFPTAPTGYTPTYAPQSTAHTAPTAPPPPAPAGPPTGFGGPPNAIPESAVAPQAPSRRRAPLKIGVTALAVVTLAAAAWAFTRDSGKDSESQGTGGRSPSSATTQSQAPGSGASSADSPDATTASSASPTTSTGTDADVVIYEKKPLTLRAQTTETRLSDTNVDLDAPEIDTSGIPSGTQDTELVYSEQGFTYKLEFVTTTGKSAGTTREQCAEGAATNALPSELTDKELQEELPKGTVLCTVTSEGNLAMIEIKDVVMRVEAPDYVTEVTLWKVP